MKMCFEGVVEFERVSVDKELRMSEIVDHVDFKKDVSEQDIIYLLRYYENAEDFIDCEMVDNNYVFDETLQFKHIAFSCDSNVKIKISYFDDDEFAEISHTYSLYDFINDLCNSSVNGVLEEYFGIDNTYDFSIEIFK